MEKTTTAERLKQLMRDRNLKQKDILDLCARHTPDHTAPILKSTISQYISGKVEPRPEKLALLARALNVSEAWLKGYPVPPNPAAYSSPHTLSDEIEHQYGAPARELLALFADLDPLDQGKVIGTAAALHASPKYTTKAPSAAAQ